MRWTDGHMSGTVPCSWREHEETEGWMTRKKTIKWMVVMAGHEKLKMQVGDVTELEDGFRGDDERMINESPRRGKVLLRRQRVE